MLQHHHPVEASLLSAKCVLLLSAKRVLLLSAKHALLLSPLVPELLWLRPNLACGLEQPY